MKIKETLLEGGTKKVQKKKKITLRIIFITVIVLALALSVLMVIGLVMAISGRSSVDPENVEANIGQTKTVTLTEAQLYEGTLLMLDSEHPYIGTINVELIKSIDRPQTKSNTNAYHIGGTDILCGTADAIKALNSMIEGFYKAEEDDNIYIANAHNNNLGAEQDAIYVCGTAFELQYYTDPDGNINKKSTIYGVEKYNWIYNNAHKYGFIVMSAEGEGSNVFRYVGTVHATAMKNGKMTFDGYLETLRGTTAEAPLTVHVSGSTYGVYYVPAAGEHKVPVDFAYTVSGNNTDGYIITVKVK